MKQYEFGYDASHFEQFRVIAKRITGIEIDSTKMDMIYTRLVRIMRMSPYADFTQYVAALVKDDGDLTREFVNAITTNLTSFFRERHHFDLLKTTALPELMKQKKGSKTIKIWSAACSTGEEPYSLAFMLDEFFVNKPGWDYKIFASDIDTNVLKKARAGIYEIDAIENISAQDMGKWFHKGVGVNEGFCRVKPYYAAPIEFFQCNLMEPFKFDWVFDIIFCRNVLIYFDSKNQNQILEQLMLHLTPHGFLFTGHSESFMYHYKKTKLISKTMYRKVS